MADTENNAILAASPFEIYSACTQVFADEDWLTFEPETLLHELKDEVSSLSADKLLAVQALGANASLALTHSQAFEKIVNAFCNNVCVMDVWQPPYVEEMCYAVRQMRLIMRETHPGESPEFSGEVPGYVAAAAKHRGWAVLPKDLSFAQQALDFLTGVNDKSARYRENRELIDGLRRVAASMTAKKAAELLEDPDFDTQSEDPRVAAIAMMAGAVLYDPTLPYADRQPAE